MRTTGRPTTPSPQANRTRRKGQGTPGQKKREAESPLDREEGKNKTRGEAGHGRRVMNTRKGASEGSGAPFQGRGIRRSHEFGARAGSGGENGRKDGRKNGKFRERRDRGEERRGLFAVREPGIEKTRTEGSSSRPALGKRYRGKQ